MHCKPVYTLAPSGTNGIEIGSANQSAGWTEHDTKAGAMSGAGLFVSD